MLYPSLPLLLPGLGKAGALFSDVSATVALDVVILLILGLRPQGLLGEAYRRRA